MVRTPRKTIIDQKPNTPISPSVIAQGKRKATSRSKMMNRIATGVFEGLEAAFVGGQLLAIGPLARREHGCAEDDQGQTHGDRDEYQDRQVFRQIGFHAFHSFFATALRTAARAEHSSGPTIRQARKRAPTVHAAMRRQRLKWALRGGLRDGEDDGT
jgi:hypothetical protein